MRGGLRGGARGPAWAALAAAWLACAGCSTLGHSALPVPDMPRELDKVSLPTYVLETPDVILIDAVRLVPKPPYRIEPLDELYVNLANPLAEPLSGVYPVDPSGNLDFGPTYGSVRVVDLTQDEARRAIAQHLAKVVKDPVVQVSVARARALQQIRGEHLIRPDGTVGLGTYGSVHVSGLTIQEAKEAIEAHLTQFVVSPRVSVDVAAYNSKVYYVITDGAGFGEQVYRLPATGNETVLDALSQINGLPPVASRKRIWLARPAPACEHEQMFAVDWKAITRAGKTETNYQVLPGDRIYVQADPLITLDTYLARVISPIERVFGVTLLGNAVVEGLQPGQGQGTGF
jgi:polysaccharide export outer membrane protein